MRSPALSFDLPEHESNAGSARSADRWAPGSNRSVTKCFIDFAQLERISGVASLERRNAARRWGEAVK